MSKKKLFAALTLIACGGLYIGNKAYNELIARRAHRDSDESSQAVKDAVSFTEKYCDRKDSFLSSLDDTSVHVVRLSKKDSSGQKTDRYCVILPPAFSTAEDVLPCARHYIENGMNVIIMELRGSPDGSSSYASYGYDDSYDLLSVLHGIIREDIDVKIIIHGFGAGAACALIAVSEHMPKAVFGVISDSSFTTLKEYLMRAMRLKYKSRIPVRLRYELLRIVTYIRARYDINDVNPVVSVKNAGVPVLFLNGDADTRVPPSMCKSLYHEAHCARDIYIFAGEKHLRAMESVPAKYWDAVDVFIKKHKPDRI